MGTDRQVKPSDIILLIVVVFLLLVLPRWVAVDNFVKGVTEWENLSKIDRLIFYILAYAEGIKIWLLRHNFRREYLPIIYAVICLLILFPFVLLIRKGYVWVHRIKAKITGTEFKAEKVKFKKRVVNLNKLIDENLEIIKKGNTVLGMNGETNKPVIIDDSSRTTNIQTLGEPGVGKSEGIFIPFIYQDAIKGYPIIIIDAKSEKNMVDKIFYYVDKAGRSKDFMMFSLDPSVDSDTFNPIYVEPKEDENAVSESFYSTVEGISDDYYRNMGYFFFRHTISLFYLTGKRFNLTDVDIFLRSNEAREYVFDLVGEKGLYFRHAVEDQIGKLGKNWQGNILGFMTYLSQFTSERVNDYEPDIRIKDVVENNKIVYFQLPIGQYPIQARTMARVVQSKLRYFSSVIQTKQTDRKFISVIIDEYKDLAEPTFTMLLNKGRSANYMVLIAHQLVNDLDFVSKSFSDTVRGTTLNKIIMRQSDSKGVEEISKSLGTYQIEERTERYKEGSFMTRVPAMEGSVRMVDQFILGPNKIKNADIGQGYFLNFQKKVTPVNFGLLDNCYKEYTRSGKARNSDVGLCLREKFIKIKGAAKEEKIVLEGSITPPQKELLKKLIKEGFCDDIDVDKLTKKEATDLIKRIIDKKKKK